MIGRLPSGKTASAMNHQAFLEVFDWGGHLGNIWWINSQPSPHQDIFSRRIVTFWGATIFGAPEPGGRLW